MEKNYKIIASWPGYRYTIVMPGPSLTVTTLSVREKKSEKTFTEAAVGSLLQMIWLRERS